MTPFCSAGLYDMQVCLLHILLLRDDLISGQAWEVFRDISQLNPGNKRACHLYSLTMLRIERLKKGTLVV